jgi:MtN3 and saliva related transmembrane protein
MTAADLIGWASSLVLVITLFVQVSKQWRDDTSKGVSPFLFIGQLAASLGFLAYSVAIESWVFVVTNTLTSLAALCGLWITWRHRQRSARKDQGHVQRMEHA